MKNLTAWIQVKSSPDYFERSIYKSLAMLSTCLVPDSEIRIFLLDETLILKKNTGL